VPKPYPKEFREDVVNVGAFDGGALSEAAVFRK